MSSEGFVRNREQLLDHGDRDGRAVALGIVEDALDALRPDRLIEAHVGVDGETLRVDDVDYDLEAFENRYLVAAGKGASVFAEALADRLGDRLTDALVVDKRGQALDVDGANVLEADHPVPSVESEHAGDAVLSLAAEAGPDDLVVVLITGGASALLAAPPAGVSIDEQAAFNEALLQAGAPIEDINAVRKHVSRIKGGRLTERLQPATVVNLVVIDEVAGVPWGPTVPDRTTPSEAIGALERHACWEEAPASIREHLRAADPNDTPSAFETPPQTAVLADGADACEAAAESARSRGLDAAILSTTMEGESRIVGETVASIAREVADAGRPFAPPCVLLSGGETTVTVTNDAGRGGPNQEFALACADRIDGAEISVVAVDTDGTDGPTDRAGGVVDGASATRAADSDVDIDAALRNHDATSALIELGDDVVTRPGTNVNDLRLCYVADRTD